MISNKFVKIALIQLHASPDKNIALQKTITLIEQAAKNGVQIICLPELYRTIYFPQYKNANKNNYAETIPGESTKVFTKLAKKYQVVIIVPIFEKNNNGKYYNSAVVINSNGKLMDVYHKIHIPQDPYFYEQNYFTKGQSYKIYKTKYAKFAVLICYDQWFPEAARIATLHGAELIFYPTAIGNIIGYKSKDGDWHNAWKTVMRGHAIANAVHIAAVNRVGKEDKLNFWGQSFVCDSFGKVLKRASSKQEEILICKIDLAHNLRIRQGWGFLKHRRPDTYNEFNS
jgi:agmatine deiminase